MRICFPVVYSDKVDVVLDWVSGNWYISDPLQSVIYMCTHNWRYCIFLVTDEVVVPQKLALDPAKGCVLL